MASTSSSPQLFAQIHYDVFISHRGPDVKNTLASHIYHTLQICGFRVFLDKHEMRASELIDAQIEHAITNAPVHIAIFSQNYAQSPWCLSELTSMMKYPDRILSVFYDVEPSDLRRLDKGGPYAHALKILEEKRDGEKPRYDSETLQKWRKALSDIPSRSGYERKTFNGDDGELVMRVVEEAVKRLHKVPVFDVAENPVGLPDIAKHFEQTILSGDVENVVVAGMVGMGGAGKSTLAKHIFNTHRKNYDRCCFLDDVRSHHPFTELQSKLLMDLTGDTPKIDDRSEGKAILRSHRLSSCRALVIIDNIDHESQLSDLLVVKDVLRAPSLVIITSRDKRVLQQSGVSSFYDIKALSEQHAKELFCKHEFGQASTKEGFEDLVESFVRMCSGLPLSLKVFGGIVRGIDDREFWECQLKMLSENLHPDIEKRLKISYDLLDKNDKEIFLDIAGFFIGEDASMATKIWDGCGLHGFIGLCTLRHKYLVELDEGNRIRMHDHLRDLGRQIANEETNRPRGLLVDKPKDINDLLRKRTVIRGIRNMEAPLYVPPFWEFWSPFRAGRSGVNGLKLLQVWGESFRGILGKESRDVVWLGWNSFPYRCLPRWLRVDNLRVLQLEVIGRELQTLWHHKQIPTQLRELNICGGLANFPSSIGGALQHLDKIVLKNIWSNVWPESLPDEFCRLHSLTYKEIEGYSDLRSLPERFGDLTNLKRLGLSCCTGLQRLPNSFSRLMSLRHLNLSWCPRLVIQQELLGNISSLEHVAFNACTELKILPTGITRQPLLKELRLYGTSLAELPNEIGELKNLKILTLRSEYLENLPSSIWNLSDLTDLRLMGCRRLNGLPDCEVENKRPCPTEEYSGGGIYHLKDLESLQIEKCPLREVTPFTSVLRKGIDLKEPAGLLPNLKDLTLGETAISKISITQDVCPNLERLVLSHNSRLVEVDVELRTLKILQLQYCSTLKRITGFSLLSNLPELDMAFCGDLEELPNLENMTSLKDLNVAHCGKLKAITGAAHLRCLETLHAEGCLKLQSITGLEELQRLQQFLISAGSVAIWNSIRFLQGLPCCKLSAATSMTRAVGAVELGVESVLNSVGFPLVLPKFPTRPNRDGHWYITMELPGEITSCNGVITCFTVKFFRDLYARLFQVMSKQGRYIFEGVYQEVYGREGEWIVTSIFPHDSAAATIVRRLANRRRSDGYFLVTPGPGNVLESGNLLEIKKGWVVIGSDGGEERNDIFQVWNNLITAMLDCQANH